MQAQAAAYGVLSGLPKTSSTRASWMSSLQRRAQPPEEALPTSSKAVFKARLQAAGFGVVEVPKKK